VDDVVAVVVASFTLAVAFLSFLLSRLNVQREALRDRREREGDLTVTVNQAVGGWETSSMLTYAISALAPSLRACP
jgi:hypothetical protein